ncbi:MAG: hypothetical protein EPO07_18755, partial [Verrucomicrobia bacterium]
AVLWLDNAFRAVEWETNGMTAEMEFSMLEAKLWDEFAPTLHRSMVRLSGGDAEDSREIVFGQREFKTAGHEFVINGRPTYLRGTHHGGDFPLTGYLPCDVEYWRKLFTTCKEWGLNHVRFHSFCPPEAAFTAADEIGIYLGIEPGMWNTFNPDSPMEAMLYAETERIIKYYGNHPSFVMFSASNEPKGRWRDVLPKWAEHFRATDARHLYTTGTGFTDPDAPGPLDRVDFTAVQRFGSRQVRGVSGWFGGDYSRALSGVNVPVVAHELGQWVAYPDFDVIKKFTDYARPGNYEIFRDSAAANGVLEYHKEFALASGRFQLACYKEEIEANLRTPGLAGFQLLDLHDYTGQGTALVGLLNPFWEPKGYVKADEWRQFCSPIVPLARLTKRLFTTEEKFEMKIEVINNGIEPLTNSLVRCRIEDASGNSVTWGELPPGTLALGRNVFDGKVRVDLSTFAALGKYRLVVTVGPAFTPPQTKNKRDAGQRVPTGFTNTWNFWVYPAKVSESAGKNVLVTSSWSEAEKKLASDGKVLFLPRNADLDWSSPPLDNVPVFWNRLMSPGWSR